MAIRSAFAYASALPLPLKGGEWGRQLRREHRPSHRRRVGGSCIPTLAASTRFNQMIAIAGCACRGPYDRNACAAAMSVVGYTCYDAVLVAGGTMSVGIGPVDEADTAGTRGYIVTETLDTLYHQYARFDPALLADPYPLFRRLRTECPVYRSGSRYVLTRYDDVAAVLRDPRFSAKRQSKVRANPATRAPSGPTGVRMRAMMAFRGRQMLETDPPGSHAPAQPRQPRLHRARHRRDAPAHPERWWTTCSIRWRCRARWM